jgi:hypothetical protein
VKANILMTGYRKMKNLTNLYESDSIIPARYSIKNAVSFWLNFNIIVGYKKIIFIGLLFIFSAVFSSYVSNLGSMIFYIFGFLYIAYVLFYGVKNGVTFRLVHIVNPREIIDVTDRIFPLNQNLSKRELSVNGVIYSTLSHRPSDRWIYFDLIRETMEKTTGFYPKTALVLGGGGCSVPIQLCQLYKNIHVEVVELSKTIIHVAEKYFIEKKYVDRINIINNDIYKFVLSSNVKFDFICFDAFEGKSIPNQFYSYVFLKKLKAMVNGKGIIIVNYCSWAVFENNSTQLMKGVHKYEKIFNNLIIRKLERNIVMVIGPSQTRKNNILKITV